MSTRMAWIALALASALGGCKKPSSDTCVPHQCGAGQAASRPAFLSCINNDDSVTWSYGGATCVCSGTTERAYPTCQACQTAYLTYCGIGTDAGAGGDAGSNSGTCHVSFSGGYTGTLDGCSVTLSVSASGTWAAVAPMATLADDGGSGPTWSGINFVMAGSPHTGTYHDTMTAGCASELTGVDDGAGAATWAAGYDPTSSKTYGATTLTLTDLGAASGAGGTTTYAAPHGTWTATMVNQAPAVTAAAVQATITF